MLAEILVFGTLWFWLAIASIILGCLLAIEAENLGGAISVIVVGLISFFFFGGLKSAFLWIIANPGLPIACFVGYFIIGAIWSIAKWFLFVSNINSEYIELKKEWLLDHNIDITKSLVIPLDLKEKWEAFLRKEKMYSRIYDFVFGNFRVKDFKSLITMWIGLWPVSALWTIIDDPIRKLIVRIYNSISRIYESILNKYQSEIKKDICDKK